MKIRSNSIIYFKDEPESYFFVNRMTVDSEMDVVIYGEFVVVVDEQVIERICTEHVVNKEFFSTIRNIE